MLSTDLSTVFLIFASLIAVSIAGLSYFRQRASEKYVSAVAKYVESENADAVSLRRMAEMEASFTDLKDSYESLLSSHKKLRSRIGMRELRSKDKPEENGADGEPDMFRIDEAQKAAYKNRLRQDLLKRGLLK